MMLERSVLASADCTLAVRKRFYSFWNSVETCILLPTRITDDQTEEGFVDSFTRPFPGTKVLVQILFCLQDFLLKHFST
jgi:hypothetical protein